MGRRDFGILLVGFGAGMCISGGFVIACALYAPKLLLWPFA